MPTNRRTFTLREPTESQAELVLNDLADAPLGYDGVGSTREWKDGRPVPAGYHFDRRRVELGAGAGMFAAAVEALRHWEQFEVGWATILPPGRAISPGAQVAVRARAAGLWSLNPVRVIYVIDESRLTDSRATDSRATARWGFGFGTLPTHAEAGEERFLIEWDGDTDLVTYDVLAFFLPRHPLARLGSPYATWLANRFRRDSVDALRRAIVKRLSAPEPRGLAP